MPPSAARPISTAIDGEDDLADHRSRCTRRDEEGSIAVFFDVRWSEDEMMGDVEHSVAIGVSDPALRSPFRSRAGVRVEVLL